MGIAGIVISIISSWVLLLFIGSLIMGHWIKKIIKRCLKEWIIDEPLNLAQKVSLQHWFESNLRAKQGLMLERPFGSGLHFFNLGNLMFDPVYLTRTPLEATEPVETKTCLGPAAGKPLTISFPLMIGGMSYGGALSYPTKLALAKVSALTGIPANNGNGPFLNEERKLASRYIFQYSRGFWSKTAAVFQQVDMVEIALGHGAWGSAPVRIRGSKITPELAGAIGTVPGVDVVIESRLPEVECLADWQKLIRSLKEQTGGVPIAAKFGGTHYLEKEMGMMIEGGIDVLIIDGAEGGTHGAPTILCDDCGLPTFPMICRAAKFLNDHNLKNKVSLVVGGSLFTPGDFLKCLALGADAVIIGTIALLAMSHTQVTTVIPWEPPTNLIYHHQKAGDKLKVHLGAEHLANFLESCVQEMQNVARAVGKNSLGSLESHDLVALDPLYAQMAGIEYFNIMKL